MENRCAESLKLKIYRNNMCAKKLCSTAVVVIKFETFFQQMVSTFYMSNEGTDR